MVPDVEEARFRHEALFYDGDDEFVAATSAFLRDGRRRAASRRSSCRRDEDRRLREALGRDAARRAVRRHGRGRPQPGADHPGLAARSSPTHAAPGAALRGIGEPIWAERSAAELVECQRHESLLNLAFADARRVLAAVPVRHERASRPT